jgi:hypothetical protein
MKSNKNIPTGLFKKAQKHLLKVEEILSKVKFSNEDFELIEKEEYKLNGLLKIIKISWKIQLTIARFAIIKQKAMNNTMLIVNIVDFTLQKK